MKAAFNQPYSHVVYALTAPVFVTLCYVLFSTIAHNLVTQTSSACVDYSAGVVYRRHQAGHIISCGPESADGNRSVRPHRHNTDPPLFLLLYVQITNRKPRKETPGNLRIEYWGQFGGYALWRRTTNKPH